MIRVAAYTAGRHAPGARFRVRQYIPKLNQLNIQMHEYAPFLGAYPIGPRSLRPVWAMGSMAERLPAVLSSFSYDATLFQRELLSTFVTLEPLTRRPRILDVDDAIWVRRGGVFARKLAQMSAVVVCGNQFLADWFCRWNRNIHILPTPVDTSRFSAKATRRADPGIVIGWSGSSSGLPYVYEIEDSLAHVLELHPDARLLIVSDRAPVFRRIKTERVEFIRWSNDNEVSSLHRMDIGIMPLRQTEWERGKCSYKMLTYMACEVPVVVTDFGMNSDVLKLGTCGVGVRNADEWVCGLSSLIENQCSRVQMGAAGRQIVLKSFDLDALAPKLSQIVRETVGT